MPVRIYDLAKKLGLESKEVLAKAKELGIATAKVPSSSLDKITAEYLEEQLAPQAKAKQPEPSLTPAAPVPASTLPVEVSSPAVAPAPIAPPAEIKPPVTEVPATPKTVEPPVPAELPPERKIEPETVAPSAIKP